MNNEYQEFMSKRNDIILKSVGLDYSKYEFKGIGFDYELMMNDQGYNLEKIIKIQRENLQSQVMELEYF